MPRGTDWPLVFSRETLSMWIWYSALAVSDILRFWRNFVMHTQTVDRGDLAFTALVGAANDLYLVVLSLWRDTLSVIFQTVGRFL
jgi:hypothetical protein